MNTAPGTPRRFLGWVTQGVGIVLTIFGLLIFFWGYGEDSGVALFLGILVLALIGPMTWRRGARLSIIPGDVLLRLDPRPPVLYLRSFTDEQAAHRFTRFISDAFAVSPILGGFSQWAPMEQWQFARMMRRIGPYVTVIRPGQSLPELGASPIYLKDEDWQSGVVDLMKQARFVVVRAGATPGLLWEIEKLWTHVGPDRVLLIVPGQRKSYNAFCEWMNGFLRKPLPDKLGDVRLFGFDNDGRPAPIEPRDMSRISDAFTPRNGS